MITTPELIARRNATLGPHSPLFYNEPLQFVSAKGVWFTDINGDRYLDGYNNVPHVGHANKRVQEALTTQSATLNIHTRYLNDRVVLYAERLLRTFDRGLDRVLLGNSGSEANELAMRIARQHTGATGIIVSDHSYHGNTITLAQLTTGLKTREPLGPHVRGIRVPDLDSDPRPQHEVAAETLAELDLAIDSLREAGYGVAACLFDPLFSTEGLPRLPHKLAAQITERVRKAGGLVITDEVQSGFGRTGSHMWGYQYAGIRPDLVTLGKPMGNGHPVSAVITREELLEEFGSTNEFFNTFAGNPVSAAVAEAVLLEMEDHSLRERARQLSVTAQKRLSQLTSQHSFIRAAKGTGMFLGLDFAVDNAPAPHLAKRVVEAMKQRRVLISRIGRDDSVLKIRPPLTFGPQELPILCEALEASLQEI
ncbi:aminotransferase class III-fold pyridoxal phosphate-dependent enzyme [Lysinibacter sp. HNR]|uniref:aspartate aminotransferase family protein n=1 Tax=Lysinibacter sp. HNR TaxID=3031408 RepID=UPI0024353306|nr:aminotransferase class III-fold pyridoxal phosphate-dependent enzyme [Lysinibacter sp. HNR]WGD37456.1 aminotransferase class III-fold pyridoxal phosphate-dependent enzyme [Lysinibacter sp. HNR]